MVSLIFPFDFDLIFPLFFFLLGFSVYRPFLFRFFFGGGLPMTSVFSVFSFSSLVFRAFSWSSATVAFIFTSTVSYLNNELY